jgi:hypothetical protein
MVRFAVCLALAVSVAHPALGQDAAAQAEARILFNEGVKLLGEGRAAEACPKLEASLKRYDGLGTRGKLAECYEAVGRTASAWALYQQVAALAEQRGEANRVKFARDRVAALEPQLAYLRIDVPAASRVDGLTVRAGSEVVEPALFGTPTARDPGPLEVRAEAPGHVPFAAKIVITAQQTAEVTVKLVKQAAKPHDETTAPPPPDNDPRPWQRPVGIAAVALGGAALVAGAVLAGVAKSTWDDAFESGCNQATRSCNQEGFDKTEEARTMADASTGLFIAGAVVAAGGIALWITAPGEIAEIALVPRVGPGGGGLGIAGSF